MKLPFLRLQYVAAVFAALLATFGGNNSANAGAIVSATSGVINSGGPGFGTLTETLNQAGLALGYTSGATDFDTYLASNPVHTAVFAGFEWFSNVGSKTASVTYNLGSANSISAVALWNEESAGIGVLDLYGSLDGVNFTALALGLLPTDHPGGVNNPYAADVFSFATTSLQYVRFDMSACPQASSIFDGCAIGEVAFRQQAAVPEPGIVALLALGLAGLGAQRRRKV